MSVSLSTETKPKYRSILGGNAEVITQVIERFPLVSPELIARITGLSIGTVRNNLTRLMQKKRVSYQREHQNSPILYRPYKTPVVKQVYHKLSLAEELVGLTLALRRRNNIPIVDGCLRDTEFLRAASVRRLTQIEGAPKKEIIPDEAFVLEDNGDRLHGFWETHTGTQKKDYEIRDKCLGYWHCRRKYVAEIDGQNEWGITRPRVYFMTATDREMLRIREIAATLFPRQKGSTLFWFSSRERWSIQTPEKLLEPIWITARDDSPRAMLATKNSVGENGA